MSIFLAAFNGITIKVYKSEKISNKSNIKIKLLLGSKEKYELFSFIESKSSLLELLL